MAIETEFKYYTLHNLGKVEHLQGTVFVLNGVLYFQPYDRTHTVQPEPILIAKPDDPYANADGKGVDAPAEVVLERNRLMSEDLPDRAILLRSDGTWEFA